MKLVFAGTPQVAVPSLTLLAASGHEIAAVVTRTDAALGRKRVLTPSPVAAAAETLGLPVIKTNRLDADATAAITALEPDLGVIVAYGGLVREPLLSAPRLGWINLHFSLLPRWRGAAPVQRAIMAGDTTTGAAVFQLVAELDAGAVFAQLSTPIGPRTTAGALLDELSHSGAELLRDVVDGLAAGTLSAVDQSGDVTLAPKLALADARVDWTLPADRIQAIIRGVTPEPGAFTEIAGARLKILAVAPTHDALTRDALTRDAPAPDDPGLAAGQISEIDKRVWIGTGTQPLELLTVQPAGKTPMKAIDWWRGVAATEVVAS